MVELRGFKHMKADSAEKFMLLIEKLGTIWLMFDASNSQLLSLLTGKTVIGDLYSHIPEENNELRVEYYEEVELFRFMLSIAASVMANEIHACEWCNYVSTEKPCNCEKGRSIINLRS